MIVECPNCHVKFSVQTLVLGEGGRRVRCCRCQHVWFQMPEDAEPEPIPEVVKPLPEMEDEPVILDEEDTGEVKSANRFAGLLFLFLLLTSFGVSFLGQGFFVKTFPSSILFYEILGIYDDSMVRGIRFSETVAEWRHDDEGEFLYIGVDVSNILDQTLGFPSLEIVLKDEDGQELHVWHPDKAEEDLKSGEARTMRFGFRDADTSGRSVLIRLGE